MRQPLVIFTLSSVSSKAIFIEMDDEDGEYSANLKLYDRNGHLQFTIFATGFASSESLRTEGLRWLAGIQLPAEDIDWRAVARGG